MQASLFLQFMWRAITRQSHRNRSLLWFPNSRKRIGWLRGMRGNQCLCPGRTDTLTTMQIMQVLSNANDRPRGKCAQATRSGQMVEQPLFQISYVTSRVGLWRSSPRNQIGNTKTGTLAFFRTQTSSSSSVGNIGAASQVPLGATTG